MKNKLVKLFLFIGMLFIGISTAHAEETFTFSIGGAENVKPGDEFAVNITVSGVSTEYQLNGYKLTVSYDSNKLSIVEGSADIVADNVAIDTDQSVGGIKFRVNDGAAAGNVTLKLSGTDILVNGEAETAKYNSGTVSIRSIETDSTLKSLKIPNTVLSPEFNKNIHDYTATVTDVTSIDIDAKPSSSRASVSVTPNANQLVKGENDITIVCQAENGSQSTYSIKVTLKVTPTEEELKAQDATLKELTIKGQKIEFNSNEKKYYFDVDYETTKLTITALPTNPNAEVVITGNKKLVIGKNTIKISVTSEDKSKTEIYQIMVTRKNEEKKAVKTCPDTTSNKEWIIFTASLLLTFTLGIVLGYFLCRKEVFNKLFKKNKKPEEAVEIETLSDTIDLSDTVKKTQEAKKEK